MADKNHKPEVTIAKTVSETLANISEKHDPVRKYDRYGVQNKVTRRAKSVSDTDKNNGISKPLRRMTVSYVSIRHYDRKTNKTKCYTRNASLRLNGIWMEEAGFTSGTSLDVRVMPGCLVITTRPTETPLMKVLNKTTQLPQKEQQEVMAFLQGVVAKVALEGV
ncbi:MULTISPECIES: SymE family type I addiction module toxin [Enterobacterales]|uniref:SymE family type I addiction module toxin n=1 Tax=Enterobacterales TaxID=91347 RepID=UPI002EDA3EF0